MKITYLKHIIGATFYDDVAKKNNACFSHHTAHANSPPALVVVPEAVKQLCQKPREILNCAHHSERSLAYIMQQAQDIKALADDKQRRVFLHQNGNQGWYLGSSVT